MGGFRVIWDLNCCFFAVIAVLSWMELLKWRKWEGNEIFAEMRMKDERCDKRKRRLKIGEHREDIKERKLKRGD